MKTISKILTVIAMVFITTNLNAQSITKHKTLADVLNSWMLTVTYKEDASSTNHYLLFMGNDKYGKKGNGNYIENRSFYGTAEEMIEFIEEIKIAHRLEWDESCLLQSKLARNAGCSAQKNRIYYNSSIVGSMVYLEGYSAVVKEEYLDDFIDKIKKFEDESKGN